MEWNVSVSVIIHDAMTDDPGSLSERFVRAAALVESSDSIKAYDMLVALQKDVGVLALFSPNETLEDISTKSLSLLGIEHLLAMSSLGLPAAPGKANERKMHVSRGMSLFSSFLERLEQYELLSNVHKNEFHELLETSNNDGDIAEENDLGNSINSSNNDPMTQGHASRDAKIARFRAKQEAQKAMDQLQALKERRSRLGITDDTEEMDGYDMDALERTLAVQSLALNAGEAIEEWVQARREMPMIQMMMQMEGAKMGQERHRGDSSGRDNQDSDKRPPPSSKPLEVTHITKDGATGKLEIRKEQIQSQVFRPSWNQPTMSLEELGEIEYNQALEREQKQKEAEANQSVKPRRYEELVKDGLEDNADLVEASAELDRAWDQFKEQNPRGSGNKMGDRGDRNF